MRIRLASGQFHFRHIYPLLLIQVFPLVFFYPGSGVFCLLLNIYTHNQKHMYTLCFTLKGYFYCVKTPYKTYLYSRYFPGNQNDCYAYGDIVFSSDASFLYRVLSAWFSLFLQ